MTKLTKFEQFACGQIFHSYPDYMTFAEIIALCKDDDARESFNSSLEDSEQDYQQLNLCARYENEWWENVPALLEGLINAAKYHFGQ